MSGRFASQEIAKELHYNSFCNLFHGSKKIILMTNKFVAQLLATSEPTINNDLPRKMKCIIISTATNNQGLLFEGFPHDEGLIPVH